MDSLVYAQEPRGAQRKSRASKLSALLVPGKLGPQGMVGGRKKGRRRREREGRRKGE